MRAARSTDVAVVRTNSGVTPSLPTAMEPEPSWVKMLSARWIGVNQLVVSSELRADPSLDEKHDLEDGEMEELPPREDVLFSRMPGEFKWEVYDEPTRALLHQWRNIFCSVEQKRVSKVSIDDMVVELLEASRRYRAELGSFLVKQSNVRNPDEEWVNTLQLLEVAQSIWQLFEIFFLDPNPNVTAQMMEWLQSSVPPPTLEPQTADEFWASLKKLTVQGRKELACKLLTSTYVTLGFSPHSSLRRSTGCVSPERLIELFNTAPSLSTKKWSAERLVLSLQDWHDGLDTLLAREEVTAHFEFCRVLELLKGDPEALNEECSEWFELLVAKLLYERPTTNKEAIFDLAQSCLKDDISILDNCLLSIMNHSVEEAIQVVNQLISIRWFVAHLAHLLKLAGRLVRLEQLNVDVGEAFILEYAHSLMYSKSLWQLAFPYLDFVRSCSVTGAVASVGSEHLRALISYQPLDSDRVAIKLLDRCFQYSFWSEARSICVQMARMALKRQEYGSAMHWLTHKGCRDMQRIAELCYQLVDGHMQLKNEESFWNVRSAVDAVQDVSLCSDLQFLAKYRELHELLAEVSIPGSQLESTSVLAQQNPVSYARVVQERSMRLLVELLTGNLAPNRYWLPLLFHFVVPLLKQLSPHDTPLLSCADTCKLMSCLQDVESSPHFDVYSRFGVGDRAYDSAAAAWSVDSATEAKRLEARIQTVRIVLVASLAHSSIFESTLPSSASFSAFPTCTFASQFPGISLPTH